MKTKKFSSRSWLNKKVDPSTGSLCCYYGPAPWSQDKQDTYLELSDCHNSVRLHKTKLQTNKDFIKKLKSIRKDVDKFIKFLEETSED